ncbi:MAG: serine/threonine protein kinase [Gemmataceae bacterium]|nr:serine/threonine protein kinase [Gemmataceae bacterium]
MQPQSTNTLVAGLAAEMNERWRRGEPVRVEEFLQREPGGYPRDAVLELIYEEFCVRTRHGQPVAAVEYFERFPQYRQELEILLGAHALLETSAQQPAAAPPEVGDTLGPFQLLAELGRGGVGRVFLARQAALGDRPVVLKVTPRAGREHVALARLQHTHVVPLHAAHDDPIRDLRILCMPYFGCANLAGVLDALRGRPVDQRSGRALIAAVDDLQAGAPVSLPARGPARDVLAQSSYVEAICRIGVCLADALHYAHERGLVHLDLKPSNILLAVDGQPMLLDFHLAQAPLAAGEHAPVWLGGTPAYMPPEQRAALEAASRGQPVPAPVDGRADLYALGVVLHEALTGQMPNPSPPAPLPSGARGEIGAPPHTPREIRALPPTRAHLLNPHVSLGLSDIIHACLEPRPERRYPSAAALAADLHRHLNHQPLLNVANRSLMERWRKWRRRRPHGLVLGTMFVAMLAAALAVGLTLWDRWTTQLGQARAELADGVNLVEQGRLAEAAGSFRRGLALVESQPLPSDLGPELRGRLQAAWAAERDLGREHLARDFHRLADSLRFLHGVDWKITPAAAALADRCAALWARRDDLLQRGLRPNQAGPESERGASVEPDINRDLLDVVLLWTDLRVRLAAPVQQDAERRVALAVLREAEEVLGPSHALHRQVELLAAALGRSDEALAAAKRAAARPPRTAWEHYVLGRQLLLSADGVAAANGADAADRLRRAAAALQEAVRLQPHGLWPNYYWGRCAYRTGRYDEAVRSFSVCIGASPEAAELFAARALAHAALGQAEPALGDHAHARKRGVAGQALAAVHYNLAVFHAGKANAAAAREHLEQALRDDPGHGPARALLKKIGDARVP